MASIGFSEPPGGVTCISEEGSLPSFVFDAAHETLALSGFLLDLPRWRLQIRKKLLSAVALMLSHETLACALLANLPRIVRVDKEILLKANPSLAWDFLIHLVLAADKESQLKWAYFARNP